MGFAAAQDARLGRPTPAAVPTFGADLLDPAQAGASPLLSTPSSGPRPNDAAAVAATRWGDGAPGGDHSERAPLSAGSSSVGSSSVGSSDPAGVPDPFHAGAGRTASASTCLELAAFAPGKLAPALPASAGAELAATAAAADSAQRFQEPKPPASRPAPRADDRAADDAARSLGEPGPLRASDPTPRAGREPDLHRHLPDRAPAFQAPLHPAPDPGALGALPDAARSFLWEHHPGAPDHRRVE